MSYNRNRFMQLAAIGTACLLAAGIGTTNAKDEASVLVKKPAAAAATDTKAGPVLPPPANPNDKPAAKSADSSIAPSQELPVPPQLPHLSPPSNTTVKRPFMRPAEPLAPAKGKLVGAEPMPSPGAAPAVLEPVAPEHPSASSVRVSPTPPIKYDTDRDARRMYRSGQIRVVMLTQDPADGCTYEIPLCIPACCEGEPRVSCGRGLLGRGVVEYCWPCGFRAIVKFRRVLGDVKVEYEGD
jgi:hypothetical protein